ncbi:hypothetical protein JCM33374_g4733 [Metschnikowia sp. JCM 33374]|nr:hypothetical protein JCM33374_g4733 [Metschnikowia sp. JCM 33374]
MSTICLLEDGKSVMSTNFDTCTLILQLGSVLSTVDEWEQNGYVLRIIAFVESARRRKAKTREPLSSLRIDAEVRIVCFDSETLHSYNFMVKGCDVTDETSEIFQHIESVLEEHQWWINMVEAREAMRDVESQTQQKKSTGSISRAMKIADDLPERLRSLNFSPKSPSEGLGLGKSVQNNRRSTLSTLHQQGLSMSLNMKAQGDGSFFKYDDAIDTTDESDTEKEYIKKKEPGHRAG